MIELTKVKTDVINYGAMKVYNTFLVISQDEVDPELFTQKQLEDIFAKKYDVIKVNIDFVVDEENEVVEHECLVFKLGKASDSTVTYMSNVNNEGSLSSLVLTKENNAVSLEVVEYSLGGDDDNKATIYDSDTWPSNLATRQDILNSLKKGDIIMFGQGGIGFVSDLWENGITICSYEQDVTECGILYDTYIKTGNNWTFQREEYYSVGGAKVHTGSIIGHENTINMSFLVGDIIKDNSGFIGLIEEISFQNSILSKIVVRGISNDNAPTTHTFENNAWSNTKQSSGTQLYKHNIRIDTNESGYNLELISLSNASMSFNSEGGFIHCLGGVAEDDDGNFGFQFVAMIGLYKNSDKYTIVISGFDSMNVEWKAENINNLTGATINDIVTPL